MGSRIQVTSYEPRIFLTDGWFGDFHFIKLRRKGARMTKFRTFSPQLGRKSEANGCSITVDFSKEDFYSFYTEFRFGILNICSLQEPNCPTLP